MPKLDNDFDKVVDYRDQISSGIHQIYKLLITKYYNIDPTCLIKIRLLIDNDLKEIIEQLPKNSVKKYNTIK